MAPMPSDEFGDPPAREPVDPSATAHRNGVDVVVVGSTNLDVVVRCQRIPAPGETVLGSAVAEYAGGKGLNQAVAAARSGARTAFVSALGDDAAGAELRALIAGEGIDASGIETVSRPTGRAFITVDDAAENSIVVVPGANALVPATTPVGRVVLAQLEVPMDTVRETLSAGQAAGAVTILNPAPAEPIDATLIGCCDVIVANEHEVKILGGVDHIRALGCPVVVVTLGENGVDLHEPGGLFHVPAFPVTAVDTTGAGDAFCGSFAAQLANDVPLRDAVRWAAAAGAIATTTPGAVPGQPHRTAIQALLAAS